MIYVDEIFAWPGKVASKAEKYGRKWCHLWCDPGEEEKLHAFAKSIGLKREYFQLNRSLNHYDLIPSKRAQAILNGATPIKLIDWYRQGKL